MSNKIKYNLKNAHYAKHNMDLKGHWNLIRRFRFLDL